MRTVPFKHDQGKSRMDLIPPESLVAMGDVLSFGAKKYSARQWELGLAWGRLHGAALRHLTAWASGEDLDPESGLPHLHHALCSVAMLVATVERRIGEDDRRHPADPRERTRA